MTGLPGVRRSPGGKEGGMKVKVGKAQAVKTALGWEILTPGTPEDFNALTELLMEVVVRGVPLEEAAPKYGAEEEEA